MKQEWISVKERLPERTEPFLWYDDENILRKDYDMLSATVMAFHPVIGRFKATYNYRKEWHEISSISSKSITPTHWMPLPEPPTT